MSSVLQADSLPTELRGKTYTIGLYDAANHLFLYIAVQRCSKCVLNSALIRYLTVTVKIVFES